MEFEFNQEKSLWLKHERGISFDELIALLDESHILNVMEHPNKEKYGKQKIYVVNIAGYVYLVPFVQHGNKIFLKTIIPSRKATVQYLSPQEVKDAKKRK